MEDGCPMGGSPVIGLSGDALEEFALRHFDHHSLAYRDHSADVFRLLREKAPVARSDAYGGFYVVSSYDDVCMVARDDATFSSERGITIPSRRAPGDRPPTIPIEMDPPASEAFRSLLLPLFSPQAIDAYGSFLRDAAAKLVDGFIERGEACVVREFGSPLTSLFTMQMAGIDHAEADFYADRIQTAIANSGSESATAGYMEARQRVTEEVQRQKRSPRAGGLIDHLLKARLDDRQLEDWEIEAMVWLVLLGGVDSTQAAIANMIVHLSRDPALKQHLIEHPETWDDAVEEFLRFITPQQGLCRTVTREVQLNGVALHPGDRVFMSWASANRDERHFEQADGIVLQRKNKRHVAFGVGKHRCIGSNIGRLEILIALEQFLTRLPDFQVDEQRLAISDDIGTVRAFRTAPISFTPGARS